MMVFSLRDHGWRSAVLVLVASCGWAAWSAAEPTQRAASTWPPQGEAQKIMVTRDAWMSGIGQEREGNNGGAPKLKLKGIQEMSLFDVDAAGLKGKRITGALLHLKCTSPSVPARRVSVSTVATPWVEGTGGSYAKQEGSVCFVSPALGKGEWAYPGSSVLDAAWGKGHTLWRFADATVPDAGGWQAVAIEPDVVAANAAGLSHGFAVMDDVGSEWSAKGGAFQQTLYPNRFFASREQNNARPWLEVWTDGEDRQAPEAVKAVEVDTAGLPPGQALVKWATPADRGGGRTLGFNVRYSADAAEKPMPRYLVPMARKAGEEVRMLIQDLGLKSGQSVRLDIEAVDASGNVGPAFSHSVTVSALPATLTIADSGLEAFAPSEKLPEVGGLKVAVLDMLDKVEAKTGKLVPDHPAGYKGGNHLWSADRKLVRLQAARNEAVAFLVNLEGKSDAVEVKLAFAADAGLKTEVYALDCVETGAGMMPDAAVPLGGAFAIPAAGDPQAADASNASLLGEVYVPHAAAAGLQKGTLTIAAGGQTLVLAVELTVWDFTLPDKLSFIPEMNAYGTANPTANLAYYRLAHEHRTCINRLYYGWNCTVKDNAGPAVNGDAYDWSAFDRDFAPLFDGSAFKDLPRKGEPLDVFYLPLNEDWPVPVKPHYRPSYWADEAFAAAYPNGFRKGCAEFARHFNEKKWSDTIFQFYLNNKVYYKKGRPFDSLPAPWIFDEPAQTQDYWALRWYGILFHQGVTQHAGAAKLWYRSDISRTQFDRDLFWGLLDMEVMGGTTPQKVRMKQDEQRLWAPAYFTEYGSANDPKDPNLQPVVWSLLAWSRGSVGILPWQTIGTKGAWDKGEATCVFYPREGGPVASVRLKAFTRGQQDIEYLTLLADVSGAPLFAVADGMQRIVDLSSNVHKTSETDAGTIRFDKADASALWKLRTRVGAMVSAKKPAFKRVVRPMPNVPRDMNALPDLGYVTVAPPVPAAVPEM